MTTNTDCGLEPDLGNLAWAPVNDFKSLEQLDQFNGVPTLAIIETMSDGDHLVWRVAMVGESSLWLYVPLNTRLRKLIERKVTLEGVIFNLRESRYATVGFAHDNRLFFEREYWLEPGHDPNETAHRVMAHALQALNMALEHDLPPSRKRLMRQAKRELQLASTS